MTNRRAASLLFLLLTVPVPTIGMLLALVLFPEASWSKAVFSGAKLWLLAVPLVWLIAIEKQGVRRALTPPRWSNRGMLAGHLTGAIIFAGIAIAWYGFARDRIDAAEMGQRMRDAGLSTLPLYILGAIYWCTLNSLLEEYFWRWFVYRRLAVFVPGLVAALGSGVLFTVHHVFAIRVYMPWDLTILASLGVLVGGVTWSWIYHRYGNIYAAYISHVYADVIIFWIGYQVAFAR